MITYISYTGLWRGAWRSGGIGNVQFVAWQCGAPPGNTQSCDKPTTEHRDQGQGTHGGCACGHATWPLRCDLTHNSTTHLAGKDIHLS